MSETLQTIYNAVFEEIKINLVPKVQYEASQREVAYLREERASVDEELKNMKLKYEEQKLTIKILQAEKESLKAEKKTFEVKVKEVSLKLKQKTYQHLSLLNQSHKNALNASQNNVCVIEKKSTGSQTIKEEPPEIGVVNVPASCSSSKASKRTSTSEQTLNYSKRCMTEKSKVKSIECSQDCLESDSDSEEDDEFAIEEIKDFRVLR